MTGPVSRADVAGAISSYYGVAVDASAVDKLAALIHPEVTKASARDPTSWKSVFPGVIAKYESMARELGLGVSAAERDRAALKTANRTDANFATALGRLGADGLRHYASAHGGPARERGVGGEDRNGADAHETLSATAAARFARELGISPAQAALFTGGSNEMRDALRDAIKSGKAISDDKVKSMNDVGMVLGAIRAGKLKPDDPRIPESVKHVIEDMKNKGIDPTKADTKTIQKYLKENPKALEAARSAIATATARDANRTDAQVKQRNDAIENAAVKAAKSQTKTKPKEKSSDLGV